MKIRHTVLGQEFYCATVSYPYCAPSHFWVDVRTDVRSSLRFLAVSLSVSIHGTCHGVTFCTRRAM